METKLICIELENVHSGNIELVRDEYNQNYYRMSILGQNALPGTNYLKSPNPYIFSQKELLVTSISKVLPDIISSKNLPKKHQKNTH